MAQPANISRTSALIYIICKPPPDLQRCVAFCHYYNRILVGAVTGKSAECNGGRREKH